MIRDAWEASHLINPLRFRCSGSFCSCSTGILAARRLISILADNDGDGDGDDDDDNDDVALSVEFLVLPIVSVPCFPWINLSERTSRQFPRFVYATDPLSLLCPREPR